MGGIEAGDNWMDFPVERQGYLVETLTHYADLLAHNMDRVMENELPEALRQGGHGQPAARDRCPLRLGTHRSGSWAPGIVLYC